MRDRAIVYLGDHLVEAHTRVGLELRQLGLDQARGVLLQLGADGGAAVAREVRQLNPSLLGLATQSDGALGSGQSSLPQDRAALVAQHVDPRPPARAIGIAIV